MLEIAFDILYFCGELMKMVKLPPDTKERIGQSRYARLYAGQQIRDALNMLCSLIVIIIRNAPGLIRLDRIGSNPLKHVFGKHGCDAGTST
jgi:hypothetical protein